MPTELAKTFDPSSTQEQALKLWHDHNAFHAEPTDPGRPYSIVIPPPNVTAALHLGHALNNTLQDILIRYHRMLGDNTCWLPGTDHAGIGTQTVVEKRVLMDEGKRRVDFKREDFVAKIQAWKDEYEVRITNQLKAMGCSCDWQRQAFTMDPPRAKAVREAFFRLFKDGLIYRGKRLVNWDPATQTALADDEVENEELDGHFYYLKYPLTDGTGHVTVATTRPETMLGDTAVAINPKDPRAKELRGKHVRLPIVNREIPIVEDDYVVMPVQFGGDEKDPKAQLATGFLKVTPAHDPNDYDIGLRHKLPVINVMAPDASISDKFGWSDVGDAGFVLGKSREEARQLIVDWFKRNGLLEGVKPYRHSVGHSYRSHVPIEPYLSDQWYCKVTDPQLSGAALRAIANDQFEGTKPNGKVDEWDGQLRFYPSRYAKTFQTWHENIRDWCISRQLWWGHRIPVWHRTVTSRKGSPWDDIGSPLRQEVGKLGRSDKLHPIPVVDTWQRIGCIAVWRYLDEDTYEEYICPPPALNLRADEDAEYDSEQEFYEELEAEGFRQDPDVLDTWFSSGLWPLSTLNWPDDTPELRTWNPTSVLCTAREIITLWVSRMTMFNLYFRNKLPFHEVSIHPMVQDGHGQKMSKSLGNGVDPMDIIANHGADAMRFTLAQMATNTQDVRMPVDLVDPWTGEAFTPKYVTDSAGYTVAAPIQESPKDPKKKMVSSYGLASGKAKPTPEMPLAKNTSSKFDQGRNFCNKLWNAARFVLMQLENTPVGLASASGTNRATNAETPAKASPTEAAVDETKWSLADRWIVSRFNRTVAETNDALKNYRFDQIARAAYDFFWRDFCDWYVEAVKPAMKDPARAPQTAHVLASVLDGSLRLLHPMIPFITEILYQRLNEIRPQRGLPNRLECANQQPATSNQQLLIRAPWPTVGSFSEAAEHIFPKLQEVITTIRNLRNQYNVPVKQPVTVSISAPAEPARQLTENREVIELLATCKLNEIRPDLKEPPDSTRATAAGVDIFVSCLVDKTADAGRIAKQREDLVKKITTLKGRMANESYMAKAPPKLVEETKSQLAAAEAELAKLG